MNASGFDVLGQTSHPAATEVQNGCQEHGNKVIYSATQTFPPVPFLSDGTKHHLHLGTLRRRLGLSLCYCGASAGWAEGNGRKTRKPEAKRNSCKHQERVCIPANHEAVYGFCRRKRNNLSIVARGSEG